tara:strand:+ start:707 stop:1063 length:357 start_codon:yes stop_codon:yes gene_type:complete
VVNELDIKAFKKEIIVKRKTCVVKFHSDTCPLCVALAPVYEEIANEMKAANRSILFYKVDVDKEKELSDRLDFDGVPTLFLFHDGKYSEIPYPYDDPDDLTGYKKDDIILYIQKKVGL